MQVDGGSLLLVWLVRRALVYAGMSMPVLKLALRSEKQSFHLCQRGTRRHRNKSPQTNIK